jgi:hypothetical protein
MLNSINNKQGVLLISAIMAVVATALFFVIPVSLTFFVAYFFTLLAIALFFFGSLYMLSNPQSYPWLAAFPMIIWQYLVTQLLLSASFVIRDMFFTGMFPVGLFVFLHILLLGVFSVKLIFVKSGKEIIETKDDEIKQKVNLIRLMQADVESILRGNPEYEKPLKQVIEAIKYSDPMSHSSLGFYDDDIQRLIASMVASDYNDPTDIPKICEKLLRQIADRNSRVRLMK